MKIQNMIRIRWILAALFMLAAGCFYSCTSGGEGQQVRLVQAGSQITDGGTAPEGTKVPGSGTAPEGGMALDRGTALEGGDDTAGDGESRVPADCYVYVCGEVVNPGVYRLSQGQRIFEAVEAAGGFTARAARNRLNLAEKVWDGMQVEVPDAESAAEPVSRQEESRPGKVNINTATREELMGLTGIGKARAEDIITYRQEKGYFQTIEDIMKVPGIKDKAFEKIQDDITV